MAGRGTTGGAVWLVHPPKPPGLTKGAGKANEGDRYHPALKLLKTFYVLMQKTKYLAERPEL